MDETERVIQGLCEAIENERNTYEFYADAAQKAVDEYSRRMFQELAEEEAIHLRMMQAQYESLSQNGTWFAVVNACELRDEDLAAPVFYKADLESLVRKASSDLEALLAAAVMESDMLSFYVSQYKTVLNPVAKALYGNLIKAEREHFEIILSNWEFLTHAK